MDEIFPEGLDFSVRPLMERVPAVIQQIPAFATKNAEDLREIVESLHLRVTGMRTWRLEAHPYGIVYVSKKAIEVLWAFAFAHVSIYEHLFAGKAVAGDIELEDYPELAVPRQLLHWCYAEAQDDAIDELPVVTPVPNPDAALDSVEEKAFSITLYALLFHLYHELSHVYFDRINTRFDHPIKAEQACDSNAIEWLKTRKWRDARDQRRGIAGAAVGLAYVAAYGIDSGRHDGLTHPRTYDRLVETLQHQFCPEDDLAWAIPTVILATHANHRDIFLPEDAVPEGGFRTFYEAVEAFRRAIHASAKPN
jgi:hypothetical protein